MMPAPVATGLAAMPGVRNAFVGRLPFSDASLRIACAEHTSMQAVHPICSLRLCAHSLGW